MIVPDYVKLRPMPEMSPQAEIDALERKLDASRGVPGYGDRVKAIEARLAVLRA